MSDEKENDCIENDDLSKANLYLYEHSIEIWRTEEKCFIKIKSIQDIENSILQVNTENEWLEKQLNDTKTRIAEVRDNIVSIDNTNLSFYETLTDLEVKCKKKQFSKNKSRSAYELQLFIRMELWQKEEEQLSNIPEIKELKMAELELKNTMLEYEKLLTKKDSLLKAIESAKEENDKKQNANIVKFANVFIETLSLKKREKQCEELLRKLEAEYQEKLDTKSALLISQQKKTIKVSFFTHTLRSFNSTIITENLDTLKQHPNPIAEYSRDNISLHQNVDKKKKNRVTFQMPPEDNNVFDQNHDILNTYKKANTSTFTKTNSELNSNQSSKTILSVPEKIHFNKINKSTNKRRLITPIDKCKTNKTQYKFEFKKPCNSIQEENNFEKSVINQKIALPSVTNKDILIENSFIENKPYDATFCQSVDNKSSRCSEKINSLQKNHKINDNDDNLPEKNSSEPLAISNLSNPAFGNTKMFDSMWNSKESPPQEQNNMLSGSFWNKNRKYEDDNSANSSLSGSEYADLFGNNNNLFSDIQLNFMDSLNNNSNSAESCTVNNSKMKIINESDNCTFQLFKDDSFKTTDNASNMSTNKTAPNVINSFKSIRPNFTLSEQFKYQFN